MKKGMVNSVSFARLMKLFPANESLVIKRIAILKTAPFKTILTTAITLLQENMPA